MGSYNIHGEVIVDFPADVTTLTAVTLYDAGSPGTKRTLLATEFLHITDVIIVIEGQGTQNAQLVVDTAAGGRYVIATSLLGTQPLVIHFNTPFICPKGVVPKFKSAGLNRNMCIIQGFIRGA